MRDVGAILPTMIRLTKGPGRPGEVNPPGGIGRSNTPTHRMLTPTVEIPGILDGS
jgi:hypothetical protein